MKQVSARKLDIVLRSAEGLKKVNISRMAAYAVAWIEPSLRVPSHMDKRHGRNPVWDTTISIELDERTLGQGKCLHIELLGQGLVSTKPIGFVSVDMTEILSKGSEGAAVRAPFLDYPVTRRSGRQQGILNFELCLQATSSAMAVSGEIQEVYPSCEISPAASDYYSSAPSPLQYQRESSVKSQQHEMSSYFSRKNMSRPRDAEDTGFGVAILDATNSSDHISKHEEISLLNSYG